MANSNCTFVTLNTILLISGLAHLGLTIYQFTQSLKTNFYFAEVYFVLLDLLAIGLFIYSYCNYNKSQGKFYFILFSYMFYATGIMAGGYIFTILTVFTYAYSFYGLAVLGFLHFILTFIFTTILYINEEEVTSKGSGKVEQEYPTTKMENNENNA